MPSSADAAPRGSAPRLLAGLAAALAILVGGLLWWRGGDLRQALVRPETQVREALGRTRSLRLALGRGEVVLEKVRIAEPLVEVAGDHARVAAMVEADGVVLAAGSAVRLAVVARERFTMVRHPGAGWRLDDAGWPDLLAVLALLQARLDAFNARDAERYGRLVAAGYRGRGGREALLERLAHDLAGEPRAALGATAWQVRIDDQGAVVGEDEVVRLGGGEPRPLRARLDLAREGTGWTIVGGL